MSDPKSRYALLQHFPAGPQRDAVKLLMDRIGNLERQAPSIGSVSQPLTSHLDAGSNRLTQVADPTAGTDAVTLQYLKKYVQGAIALNAKQTAVAPLNTSQPAGPLIPTPSATSLTPPNSPPAVGTVSATDAISPALLVFENSIDVSAWPITTALTLLDWQINGVKVTFDKQSGAGRWPDQPFGAPGDSLQYTLWIVFLLSGTYYASGIIQFWFGLDRNGGPPSGVALNWVYDSRWGPMQSYQPAVGENVWMFVTAGNARNNATSTVLERSQIVQIPFPSDAGGTFTA